MLDAGKSALISPGLPRPGTAVDVAEVGKRTLTGELPRPTELPGRGAPRTDRGDLVESVDGATDQAAVDEPVDLRLDARRQRYVGSVTVPLPEIAAKLRDLPVAELAEVERVDLASAADGASAVSYAVRGAGLFVKVTELAAPTAWRTLSFKVSLASGRSYHLRIDPILYRIDMTSIRRMELEDERDDADRTAGAFGELAELREHQLEDASQQVAANEGEARARDGLHATRVEMDRSRNERRARVREIEAELSTLAPIVRLFTPDGQELAGHGVVGATAASR